MLAKILIVLILCIYQTSGCRGKPNPYQIAESNFQKVQSHLYGDKYVYYNAQINQYFYMIKVNGTSYQAGLAYGTLMKKEIGELINELWAYYTQLAEQQFKFITKIPKQLQPLARSLAIKLYKNILLANYFITKKYTPNRFIYEYMGIADGSGINMNTLIEINMLPQYTRAGCTIFGAWGKATKNGDLIHLRALDWDVHNPMNKYPTLIIYDLKEKGSSKFINVGWAGFVGSLTGFGQNVGIGEKVRKQNPVKQNETRYGMPWTYALRQVLQFSKTIDDALNFLNKTKRTCSIYVGISSVKNNTFRLIQYSYKQFRVYDDKNFPYVPNIHEQMDDVVFQTIHEDKNDSCFNMLVRQKYGEIDADWIVNVLAASHHTGDTQMAAYNFNKKQLLLQVSSKDKLAFERPMIRIKLQKMLSDDSYSTD